MNSSGYSLAVKVATVDGDVVAEWGGLLIADVQPLIDLIRHHGLIDGDGDEWCYKNSVIILGPVPYVDIGVEVRS